MAHDGPGSAQRGNYGETDASELKPNASLPDPDPPTTGNHLNGRRNIERKRGNWFWGGVIAVSSVLMALIALALLTEETPSGATGQGGNTQDQLDDTTDVDAGARHRAGNTNGDGLITTTTAVRPATQPSDPDPERSAGGPAPVWPSELESLVVAPETSRTGYDRDLFKHWIDADGNGCDTRCEVLERQRLDSLPGLPEGGWLSVYDGYSTDDPSELDVDHVVALSEAWVSGASEWDDLRREAFANDLDSGQLVAVTAATNRSKSDRDPAEWQPPNRSAWCEWGAAWIGVKAKWSLTADRAEVDALANIMRGCP